MQETTSHSFYDCGEFHVQCEWLNHKMNLKEAPDDIRYGTVTITDLRSYWQQSITRKLLIDSFKVSNALVEVHRDDVLTAAFLGESSVHDSELEWKIQQQQDKDGCLQMRLRTYNDRVPFTAGSFLLDKVPESEVEELHRSWFKRSAQASSSSTQKNKALQKRINNITETNKELKQTIDSMNIRESKNKFVIINKFVHLLNEKKKKIFILQEALKRKREDDDGSEPQPQPKRPTMQRFSSSVATAPAALDYNLSDSFDDDDDDELDVPQTVR